MFFFRPGKLGTTCHKTGTYVGDGNDNKNIDIGVNLSVKNNAYVIIKTDGDVKGIHRIEYGQGDKSMMFFSSGAGTGNDMANAIQAFTNTGFQVGTSNEVNHSGQTYRYIAFWTEG